MIARYPTKSQRNAQILKHHGDGLTVPEIGAATGVATSTIRDFLRDRKLKANPAPKGRADQRETQRNAQVVADMARRETAKAVDRETVEAIAKRYRISRQRIYAICNAAKEEVNDGANTIRAK